MRRRQVLPRASVQDPHDHLVDGFALDSREVSRPRQHGVARMPVGDDLYTGGIRYAKLAKGKVEVEVLHDVDVVRRVHQPQARGHPQLLQLIDEHGDHAALFHATEDERQRHPLARVVRQGAVLHHPTGFAQEFPGLEQQIPVAADPVRGPKFERLGEQPAR